MGVCGRRSLGRCIRAGLCGALQVIVLFLFCMQYEMGNQCRWRSRVIVVNILGWEWVSNLGEF